MLRAVSISNGWNDMSRRTKINIQSVKNRFILNPFWWFTLVWTMVFLVHSLGITSIYPVAPFSLFLFMLSILVCSTLCGIYYQKNFLVNKKVIYLESDKPNRVWIIVTLLMFVLEVVYSKMLPLFEVLNGNVSSYQNFGIPHITFLIVSSTIALNAVASVKLFYGKEHKIAHALTIIMCLSRFILSYSRGILIFSFLITLVIGLSKIKFSFKIFFLLFVLAIIGALAFNIFGNIRQKAAFNDSSYIMNIAGFKDQYRFLSPFSWVITYIDSPLGNLCYNYINVAPTYEPWGLISQLLPDFLSKRILPNYDSSLVLIQSGLTASSMFAGGYKYFGIFGMTLSYLELVILIFVVTRICKNNGNCFLACSSSLCIISAMTFFDNMATYSGYSFFLIFIVFYRLFLHKDIKLKVIKADPNVFLKTYKELIAEGML